MTTIAFVDGCMASDSCITSLDVQVASVCKVYKTPVGALVGASGDADCRAIFTLIDKAKNAKQLPTKQEIEACRTEFELIIAFSPSSVWYVGCSVENGHFSGYVYEGSFPYAATGSGWKFALAAMRCGKTAREAVQVACEFDRLSKLPVHSISFDPKKPRSKPKPK